MSWYAKECGKKKNIWTNIDACVVCCVLCVRVYVCCVCILATFFVDFRDAAMHKEKNRHLLCFVLHVQTWDILYP